MMLTVSSMVPFYLLCHVDQIEMHVDQIEMQYNFFGHVVPLALATASYDANGIINSITEFVSQDNQHEVQHDFLAM